MKKQFTSLLVILSMVIHWAYTQEPPNIIVFIADDVSWNDFGCYGNPVVQTPNIDDLASNGLMFTNFYLTASSCSPSRNSIMTGRYPHNTGAAELHTEPPVTMRSFPELLKNQDYYTVQAGKFHMGEYAKRGFHKIYDNLEEVGNGGENKWVDSVRERPKDKPFFMWFAAYDAHRNWGPNKFSGTHSTEDIVPDAFLANDTDTKEDLAKYYDEIKRFDHYIGLVVEELKIQEIFDDTIIIVMADNGRPFPNGKTRLNDRGMKTPFILHWANRIDQQLECSSLVSAIDVAPTLLGLAGIAAPEQFQGHSFNHLIKNPDSSFRNYVFSEHNWHDYEAHGRMVRTKDFMYIMNSRPLKPLMGPADAVSSPSFKSLDKLRATGSLTPIQADIFIVPRPHEELYSYEWDPKQFVNVASNPNYLEPLNELKSVLQEWMVETGDNVPENLTKDWYHLEPDYIRTDFHGIRGEMPGASLNATKNNNKGKF